MSTQGTLSGKDFDICKCGDFRHQHEDGSGPCGFNKPHMGHHGAPDCERFVLQTGANPTPPPAREGE